MSFPPPRPVADPNASTRPSQVNPTPPQTQPVYPPLRPRDLPPTLPPAQPYDPPRPPRDLPPTPPPMNAYPPLPSQYVALRDKRRQERRRQNFKLGCGLALALLILSGLCLGSFVVLAMFVAPVNGTILVLGIDRVPDGSAVGRSDTNVLVRVDPNQPRIVTLAIPRDLWVKIPTYGENRINAVHFFAEADRPGSGPAAAMRTFQELFGVPIHYYVRVRLEGVPALIDAMGGLDLDLPEKMGGLEAGKHHLDGTQALAFVRDRKNSDDFFRMAQGQVFIKAVARQLLAPGTWPRLPAVYYAYNQAVDTNLSFWQLANIGLTAVRLGPANIESHTLPREDTTPANVGGAQVLLPRWDLIRPLVDQLLK